jgi:membrane protease YdiL (CAAX protease family)
MFVGPGLGFRESVGIGLFYLLLPAIAVAQLPLLRVHPIERVPVYLSSVATILAIGAIAVGLGWELSAPPVHGVTWVPGLAGPLWISGVTIGGLAVIGVFGWIERRMPHELTDLVLQLIPRTRTEKLLFVGLSLAAGLGEELAYRGYALSVVQLAVQGPWTGAALSSVAFGVLHSYQGPVGMVRTSVMGLILAGSVILSGSLLPAIIGHTLIDLVAGFVIGPRMLSGRTG